MSWGIWAAKLFGAKPVYLYRVTKDSNVKYYTSRSTDISATPAAHTVDFFEPDDFFSRIDFFAETFKAEPVLHSAIAATAKESKKLVTVKFSQTDAFAQRFIGPLGIATTGMTIWHGFENDPDGEYLRMFLGEMLLVKPTWKTVALVCEDFSSAMKDKGLTDIMQRPCRHALYFGKCTLNLADYENAGTASAMTTTVVTVAEAAGQADGYYAGGIISYGGALQLITGHTGASLTVLGSVGDLQADIATSGPQTVAIAPGCNRSMSDCDTKFSNSANFGGFKEMTDSPFDGRSVT